MQQQQQQISGHKMASRLFIIALCAASLLVLVESHQLASLSEQFRSAGLDDFEGPMNEKQLGLVGQISGLYEEEEQLHSREERLLNQVGRSRPDGAQKGALEVIFNKHLLNMNRLDKLKEELKESLSGGAKNSVEVEDVKQE